MEEMANEATYVWLLTVKTLGAKIIWFGISLGFEFIPNNVIGKEISYY